MICKTNNININIKNFTIMMANTFSKRLNDMKNSMSIDNNTSSYIMRMVKTKYGTFERKYFPITHVEVVERNGKRFIECRAQENARGIRPINVSTIANVLHKNDALDVVFKAAKNEQFSPMRADINATSTFADRQIRLIVSQN